MKVKSWQCKISKIQPEDVEDYLFELDELDRYQAATDLVEIRPMLRNKVVEAMSNTIFFDVESDDPDLAAAANAFDCNYGRQKQVNDWLEIIKIDGGVMLEAKDNAWFLHPSAQNEGMWQLTTYTLAGGGPTGDMQFSSPERAFSVCQGGDIPDYAVPVPTHLVDKLITKLNLPSLDSVVNYKSEMKY